MPILDLTCSRCGYQCNHSVSLQEPDAVPSQGDLTICINCGQSYILKANGWAQMSNAELARLDPAIRAYLEEFQYARRLVITEDLALNQKLPPLKETGSGKTENPEPVNPEQRKECD